MCLPNAEEGRECVQAIKRLRGEALSRVSVKIWQVYNRPRNKQCTAAELYAPGVNHVLLVGVFNAIRVFRCALERCLAVLKTNTMTAGVFLLPCACLAEVCLAASSTAGPSLALSPTAHFPCNCTYLYKSKEHASSMSQVSSTTCRSLLYRVFLVPIKDLRSHVNQFLNVPSPRKSPKL